MKKQLIKYITAHNKSAKEELKRPSKYFKIENIHLFRTSIKKIEAALELIISDRDKDYIKKIRKKYKLAGKIRALQIEKMILSELGFKSFHLIIDKQIILKKKDFYDLRESSLLREQDMDKLKNKLHRIKKSVIKNHIIQQHKNIMIFCKKNNFNDQELHQLRIMTKKMLYQSVMTSRNDLFIEGIKFKKLVDDLGKWHDMVATRRLFLKQLGGFTTGNILWKKASNTTKKLNENIITMQHQLAKQISKLSSKETSNFLN